MRSRLRLRVPVDISGAEGGTALISWLLSAFSDTSAELMIRTDGAPGKPKTFSKIELASPFNSGDFLEVSAELLRWNETERSIVFEARKIISAGAKEARGEAVSSQVLSHPVVVATAEAVFEASPVPSKGQGLHSPLIITVAPIGYLTTREDTPYLPITPEEIAAEVARCVVEGASVVHLHARDDQGLPTHSKERYAEIVERIRSRCDVVIQIATESDAATDVMTRCQVLDTPNVDMVTLTTGTFNRAAHIAFNSKPVMEHIAMMIRQKNMVPCIEIRDLGFLENAKELAKKGLLVFPGHFELVFGAKGGMGARSSTMEHLVEQIPRGSTWSTTGKGRHMMTMASQAIAMGGHVRVGLADSVYLDPGGATVQGSAPMVARVCEMARQKGRKVADAATARRILRLSQR